MLVAEEKSVSIAGSESCPRIEMHRLYLWAGGTAEFVGWRVMQCAADPFFVADDNGALYTQKPSPPRGDDG
jgi:hypothetical protein